MRNARAKGKRIGRPPRTYLAEDARRAIAQAYRRREGSLRALAARFGTSMGTIQRCMAAYRNEPGQCAKQPHRREMEGVCHGGSEQSARSRETDR